MKAKPLNMLTMLVATIHMAHAQTLTQTFEAGESTTAWNSTWQGGATTTTFLDPGLGGTTAGTGNSGTQSYYRLFRDNTAGVDVNSAYRVSMYVQLGAYAGTASGRYEIMDGEYGSENAANLGINIVGNPTDGFTYVWQVRDNNTGWQDLGLIFELNTAYRVEYTVDPDTYTFDALVQRVSSTGTVLDSASATSVAFTGNAVTNGKLGELRFYDQASSGATQMLVDNINIEGIPEPSILLLAGAGALAGITRRRRPAL